MKLDIKKEHGFHSDNVFIRIQGHCQFKLELVSESISVPIIFKGLQQRIGLRLWQLHDPVLLTLTLGARYESVMILFSSGYVLQAMG